MFEILRALADSICSIQLIQFSRISPSFSFTSFAPNLLIGSFVSLFITRYFILCCVLYDSSIAASATYKYTP